MKIVYVVSIPWDSHRVNSARVFKTREQAEEYYKAKDEQGYNGYMNGLFVQACEVKHEKA